MFRHIAIALSLILLAGGALAQESTPTSDLERRLRDLEAKVSQMQATPDTAELRRQIDILTREVEALKTGQTKAVAAADATSYGLGAAASKVYRADEGVSFGGYGEFLYQNADAPDTPATADALRAVLYTGYKFSPRVLFNSELEVEHASTEHGGEVSLEFGYLDYLVRPEMNVRAGLVLMPVGLVNEQHEPTAYFGARRPAVERIIIPATWGELGAGVFGDVGPVGYRTYLVTGLNAEEFGAEEGIREGRQGGGEALAESWAWVGRADWHPFEGTMFGGSLYSGNSGQGRGFSGRVTLGEVHADSKFRGLSLRALVARGRVGDVAAINDASGHAGDEGIGKTFGGWYAEAAYDLGAKLPMRDMSLAPYARYERLDTQNSVPAGFSRNPANDQKIFTLGLAFKPISQTVVKVDWQNVENRAKSGADQFNIAIGYIF